MSGLPQGSASRRVDTAGVVISIALAAVAAVLVWDASQLQSNNPYGMGPHAMPVVIAVGLVILAIGNLIEALRGHPIFGHVTLTRSERSEIAAVVTELLDIPLHG